jgi:hypothetical protein
MLDVRAFFDRGMCFKDGEENTQQVEHDHLCGDWVPENTDGTITREISDHVAEYKNQ